MTAWSAPLSAHRAAMLTAGRTLHSCQTYSTYLARLADAFPAGPWAVGPADLDSWIDSLSDLQPGTRKNAITAARSFYAWAAQAGHLEEDPAALLAGRKLRPGDGCPGAWRPLVAQYAEYAAGAQHAPKTVQQRVGTLRRFAAAHPDPRAVDPGQVTAWVQGLPAGSSRRAATQHLRAFWAWAQQTGQLGSDPVSAAFPQQLNGYQVAHLPMVWTTALDDWQAWCVAGGVRSATLRTQRAHLATVARSCPTPAAATGPHLVRLFASHQWAPETRRSVRGACRSFFGWAVRNGVVETDPTQHLRPVRVPRGRPRPTPERVLADALTRADDRQALMVLLAAYAGLRRAEIAAFHPRNRIDGLLHITGKGGQGRIVPEHPRVTEAVDAELARRAAGGYGTGFRVDQHRANPADWLFPGRTPGQHVGPDDVGATLARVLGQGWSGHTLRHSFATRAYAATRDIRAVQELLGHASSATTDRYTAVPGKALHDAVFAL